MLGLVAKLAQKTVRFFIVINAERLAFCDLIFNPRLRVIKPVGAFYSVDDFAVQLGIFQHPDKQRFTIAVDVFCQNADLIACLKRQHRIGQGFREPCHCPWRNIVLFGSRFSKVLLRHDKRPAVESRRVERARRFSVIEFVMARHFSCAVFLHLLANGQASRVVDAVALPAVREHRVLIAGVWLAVPAFFHRQAAPRRSVPRLDLARRVAVKVGVDLRRILHLAVNVEQALEPFVRIKFFINSILFCLELVVSFPILGIFVC